MPSHEKTKEHTSRFADSIIRCECGQEILLLPDADATGKALEAHIAKHRNRNKGLGNSEAEVEHIREALFNQLFKKAVKLGEKQR